MSAATEFECTSQKELLTKSSTTKKEKKRQKQTMKIGDNFPFQLLLIWPFLVVKGDKDNHTAVIRGRKHLPPLSKSTKNRIVSTNDERLRKTNSTAQRGTKQVDDNHRHHGNNRFDHLTKKVWHKGVGVRSFSHNICQFFCCLLQGLVTGSSAWSVYVPS